MKILPITTHYNQRKSPNFCSSSRIVYKKQGGATYSNWTHFLRPDFSWKPFINLVKEKYKNVPKVNIINHACSDGSEPWTLAMLLKEMFGESSKKFFPIRAYDFDQDIIHDAKETPCAVKREDLYRLISEIPNWHTKYFKIIPKKYFDEDLKIRPNEEMERDVIFECKNVNTDFETPKPKNTIVMARNFWAYMKLEEQDKLAERMSKTLDDTCLVAIGALEKTYAVDKILEKHGFIKTPVDMVYTLPKKNIDNIG